MELEEGGDSEKAAGLVPSTQPEPRKLAALLSEWGKGTESPRPRLSALVVLQAPIVPGPALLSLSHLSLEDAGFRSQISGLRGPSGSPLAPSHLVNPALGTIVLWGPS